MTTVLLITADRDMRKVVRASLEDLPVRFLADCSTSREAIEAFRDERPRLVLADLFLPESSGIEIVKTLKKLDDKTVVVLLSRLRTRTIKDRAFRSGADDIVMYPADAATLRDVAMHRLEGMKSGESVRL